MARALLQTTNQTNQTVALNSIIGLGSTQRRFGCNCKLSGNAIELNGEGYYAIDVNVSITPTAAGAITIGVFQDGVQIPGAIAFTTGTAAAPEAIAIPTTVRLGCCDGLSNITVVVLAGPGVVNNVATRTVKI